MVKLQNTQVRKLLTILGSPVVSPSVPLGEAVVGGIFEVKLVDGGHGEGLGLDAEANETIEPALEVAGVELEIGEIGVGLQDALVAGAELSVADCAIGGRAHCSHLLGLRRGTAPGGRGTQDPFWEMVPAGQAVQEKEAA